MTTLIQDVRYAWRQMRLAPVFTVTVVLTLAFGIGATTAIFSLIHTVMLKSLPVADPSTLYRIGTGKACCYIDTPQEEWGLFSYDFYHRVEKSAPQFSQIAAFQAEPHILSVRRSGSADVQATFIFERFPFQIVGVAPPGFFGDTLSSTPPSIWIPLQVEYLLDADAPYNAVPSAAWLRLIGRLRPGASTAGVSGELTALLHHWLVSDAAMTPDHRAELLENLPKQRINVASAADGVGAMKDAYRASLRILLGACVLVLLIACSNIGVIHSSRLYKVGAIDPIALITAVLALLLAAFAASVIPA